MSIFGDGAEPGGILFCPYSDPRLLVCTSSDHGGGAKKLQQRHKKNDHFFVLHWTSMISSFEGREPLDTSSPGSLSPYHAHNQEEDTSFHASSSSPPSSSTSKSHRLLGTLRSRLQNSRWCQTCARDGASTNIALGGLLVLLSALALLLQTSPNALFAPAELPSYHVAFVGNSMMYYNDFPRFMASLSGNTLTQQSCLHGDATLSSILVSGNGMYKIWDTGNARVYNDVNTIFDFGACTVKQMLFGRDAALHSRVQQLQAGNNKNKNRNNQDDDDGHQNGDDFLSFDDGKNPCLRDEYYYDWLQEELLRQWGIRNATTTVSEGNDNNDDTTTDDDGTTNWPNPPTYDFIVLNDNTRSPARMSTRQAGLVVLNNTYLPWFRQTGAIPVFMTTYGYSTPYRDMGGLGSVPQFTSLTHYGYKLYAQSLKPLLPSRQKPRVAAVGVAFLVVWEENFNLWQRLFHVDQIHSSPLGSYLQGCVVYHTLYRRLPNPNVALRGDMSRLWHDARRFQPGTHRTDDFPTQAEAQYLYHVAFRVSKGYVPPSFVKYKHGEAAQYTPQDDLYRVDDLF